MKKINFILILLLFLAIIIITISISQVKQIEKTTEVTFLPVRQGRTVSLDTQKNELVVSSPEDYGMVVTSEEDSSINQEYWDSMLSSKIKEIKLETPSSQMKKIQDIISEDCKKTEEKIVKIEKEINRCREILAKDPENAQIKKKLQNLLILKSLAKELP
ncbi:MAG: hypothetical protein WAQ07_01845 [Candidatus Omnitrophota bacterium]